MKVVKEKLSYFNLVWLYRNRIQRNKIIVLALAISTIGCSSDNVDTSLEDTPERIVVWSTNSIMAELYLPTFGELELDLPLSPPVAVVRRAEATPEQLSDLRALEVERPFEFSTSVCDVPPGFDVLYLVITDEDNSTRRFSQYINCGISPGDGFFQVEAQGFISDQALCEFALTFGVMGFVCQGL